MSQITLGMDFRWILVGFWLQVGVQNGAKIDIKGGWKNDEKMMLTRIGEKLDFVGYGHIRHQDFGGVNPSSRGVGGDGVEWMLG